MKRALFIDRDGTLIVEPTDTCQIDSLELLEFIPKVFRSLYQIRQNLDFELVLVTNQDGLGTPSFPEETFWPAHNKMLKTFSGEGITFDDILIDRTFAHENAPTRKPGTGMLTKYLTGAYDLARSYVIGDRMTDVQLAKNLGSKAIRFFSQPTEDTLLSTTDWDEIYRFLCSEARSVFQTRQTKETQVEVRLNLEGSGSGEIQTGIGFFDHMLEQFARHSSCDLNIKVKGDLHIDEHHTIEDTALTLGMAFDQALGDKRGIDRYGFVLPMDDVLAQVAIDFSGRPWLVWEAEFKREKIGEMPTEMFFHFFKSFCDTARCNLNVKAEGQNEHHKIEAIFKGVARAIQLAVKRNSFQRALPSTKGVL